MKVYCFINDYRFNKRFYKSSCWFWKQSIFNKFLNYKKWLTLILVLLFISKVSEKVQNIRLNLVGALPGSGTDFWNYGAERKQGRKKEVQREKERRAKKSGRGKYKGGKRSPDQTEKWSYDVSKIYFAFTYFSLKFQGVF